MSRPLDGQRAIVVGGGSGIGLASARLAGPESSWVTGQCLSVDGGHTLRAFVDYEGLVDLPDQGAVAKAET